MKQSYFYFTKLYNVNLNLIVFSAANLLRTCLPVLLPKINSPWGEALGNRCQALLQFSNTIKHNRKGVKKARIYLPLSLCHHQLAFLQPLA